MEVIEFIEPAVPASDGVVFRVELKLAKIAQKKIRTGQIDAVIVRISTADF